MTPGDIAHLPHVVRRYLTFMGVVGRRRDWSLRVQASGRFRLAPDAPWKPIRAWQYDTRLDVARFFYMELPVLRFARVVGRDTYSHGVGHLQIRPFDLFTAQEDVGPELDIGELVTYLNDAILFAPSLVLGPEATWCDVDSTTFEVSLVDHGRRVTAQVRVDGDGAPLNFSTTDRFVRDPFNPRHPYVRCRWSTPVAGFRLRHNRRIPTAASAVWHLPQGDFSYAELEFDPHDVAFNVSP